MGRLMVIVGSACGAWWLVTQLRSRDARVGRGRDRGTVIFDNTPVASDDGTAVPIS